MPQIGDKAPEFNLLNTKRERVSLAGLSGQTVVLAFFPAAFTGVCEKELCSFRDSLTALNDLNAAVLGLSVDAPFSNGAFAERNQLNFPLSPLDTAHGMVSEIITMRRPPPPNPSRTPRRTRRATRRSTGTAAASRAADSTRTTRGTARTSRSGTPSSGPRPGAPRPS